MSKPLAKKATPAKKPHDHAAVYREIAALRAGWQQWLAAGLPPRAPLTKREVQRRITLLGRVQAVLER
jgi:hypothetical protein